MVKGQKIPNQFNPNVAADIVDIAAVPPPNRFNAIIRDMGNIMQMSAGLSSDFGMQITNEVGGGMIILIYAQECFCYGNT